MSGNEAWRNAPDPTRDKTFYDKLTASQQGILDDTLMTAEEFWNQLQKAIQQRAAEATNNAKWKQVTRGGSRKFMSYINRKNYKKSKSYKKIRRGKRTKHRRY
jgi:CRISPR/Cas system CSM-associated protein Csm2 small subunit